MAGGFAPRFVLELAFLALLAVAAALADLGTAPIVGVMCGGWVMVTLIEWLAWREETRGQRAALRGAPPVQAEEEEPPLEEATAWDIQEILVPLPGESGDALEPASESRTTVLAAEDVSAPPPRPRRRRRRGGS